MGIRARFSQDRVDRENLGISVSNQPLASYSRFFLTQSRGGAEKNGGTPLRVSAALHEAAVVASSLDLNRNANLFEEDEVLTPYRSP
jgi:hypothetical protein